MVGNCNKFHFVQPDQSCTTIGSTYGVSLTQLVAWNPAIGSQCTGLWANTYLCVGVVGSSTTLTTTTKAATTTSSGNGITTPTPTQAGMVGNCDRFHLVKSGDQCDTIASTYGITLANFYSWNPAVGKSCESLWLDTYVCVRTIGFVPPKTTTTTATTRKTTTTTAGGVATPTPTQPGMVSGCKKFHKGEFVSFYVCDHVAWPLLLTKGTCKQLPREINATPSQRGMASRWPTFTAGIRLWGAVAKASGWITMSALVVSR